MNRDSSPPSSRSTSDVSRRDFLAASSAAVALSSRGGIPSVAAEPAAPKLALQGGEKAVKSTTRLARRWGEPERSS